MSKRTSEYSLSDPNYFNATECKQIKQWTYITISSTIAALLAIRRKMCPVSNHCKCEIPDCIGSVSDLLTNRTAMLLDVLCQPGSGYPYNFVLVCSFM